MLFILRMEFIELLTNSNLLRRCTAAIAARNMENHKDKVPLFKTWTQWYVFVIAFLILLIILFYIFTKTFS